MYIREGKGGGATEDTQKVSVFAHRTSASRRRRPPRSLAPRLQNLAVEILRGTIPLHTSESRDMPTCRWRIWNGASA